MNEFKQAAEKAADKMTDFEKAKRAAVDSIVFSYPNSPHPEDNGWHVYNAITKHFADLAATYSLLCELAKASSDNVTAKGMVEHQYGSSLVVQQKAINSFQKIKELLADPQVQAAIRRKDES